MRIENQGPKCWVNIPIRLLKTFNRNIAKLVELWLECWHVMYQADGLIGPDHMGVVRRSIVRGIAAGKPAQTYWDPAIARNAVAIAKRITAVAMIPAQVYRQAIKGSEVIVQASVAAHGGQSEVPEIVRP